jgi:hypothetical protein
MLILHGDPVSGNTRKVRWALEELSVPYELRTVALAKGEHKRPEYLALNLNGKVPTIEDDGFVLWESDAILWYLAESPGRGALLPPGEKDRALVHQWMDWNAQHLADSVRSGIVLWTLVVCSSWLLACSGVVETHPPTASAGGARGSGGASAITPGTVPAAGGTSADAGDGALVFGGAPGLPFCSDVVPTPSCIGGGVPVSSYDQSCQTAADCVLVAEGPYACGSCGVCAPQVAINRTAVSQYLADVSRLTGPSFGGGGCAPCCTPGPVACCQGGQCRAVPSCARDAGAE